MELVAQSVMLSAVNHSLSSAAAASRKYIVSSSAFAAELNSGCVLLNLDTGIYYALDGTGTAIWDLLVQGRTTDEIVATLLERYEVEESRLRTDVADLLTHLEREGLACVEES